MASTALAAEIAVQTVEGTLTARDLRPGNQQMISSTESDVLALAGHEITLTGATALVGMSADAVHLALVAGEASIGEQALDPRDLILMPPYGAEPTVTMFDAARLEAPYRNAGPLPRPI